MMLRILITAATAVIAGNQVIAAEKTIPIHFVGDWCYSSDENKTTWYRLPSWTDDGHCTKILSIDPYQFYAAGWGCEPMNIRLTRDTAPSGTTHIAVITASCRLDGSATTGKMQTFEFARYKGNLHVTIK